MNSNNIYRYYLKNTTVFLISSLVSIGAALIVTNPIILFVFSLLLISLLFNRRIMIVLIIISNLIATGPDLQDYRIYINLFSATVFGYYFASDFGMKFNSYPKIPSKILKLIVFFLITILISSIFSINKVVSIIAFLRTLSFFIFSYLIYTQIKDDKDIKYLLIAFGIAQLFLGASIYYEFFQKGIGFFIGKEALFRLAGIYGNPNYVGLLLAITIPITLSFLMLKFVEKLVNNLFLILILLFQLGMLLLSDSRASFLSIAISSVVILWFSPKKSRRNFLYIIAGISIVLIFVSNLNNIIEIFLRLERISTRDDFWKTGIEILKNNLLFGTGADTFEQMFFSKAPSNLIHLLKVSPSGVGTPHPHNIFLYFWAENGILGVISIFMIFYISLKLSIELLQIDVVENKLYFIITISNISIVSGLFFRAFFEITGIMTYGAITRDLPFWVLLIILCHIYQKNHSLKIERNSNKT